VEITTGNDHACGLKSDGSVQCWGSNTKGQLNVPAAVFTQVAAATRSTCGLLESGSVTCWGESDRGQTNPSAGPFTQISADTYNYCGIRPDGSAACWGSTSSGNDGPFGVPSQKTFSNLAAGTYDVTEQVPAGWSLSDLSCDGGNTQVNGATVSVTLAQSEQVTCTYEDTPTGTIVITKQTAPAARLLKVFWLGEPKGPG